MKNNKIKRVMALAIVLANLGTANIVNAKTDQESALAANNYSNEESTNNVLQVNVDDTGNVTYLEPTAATANAEDKVFNWDNASVYFVITDRFENGNTSNDHSYGRSQNNSNYKDQAGTFHGGDIAGLTKKLKEGYFTDLGVNAIWFTAPYEQIHGYTSANLKTDSNKDGEDGSGFAYYAYHGYWALDFSNFDANMCTEDEFQEFVDTAHENGIRVVMDVVMNHVGYVTLKDASEFGFGELTGDWKNYMNNEGPNTKSAAYEQANLYNKSSSKWADWWGPGWLRVEKSLSFPGYSIGGDNDLTTTTGGLPDILSESTKEVEIPTFLKNKWQKEGRLEEETASLDAFFKESGLKKTPINYIVKWLTDYVKDYGIDGFRCDTAKHIEVEHWNVLKEQGVKALEEWRTNNSDKPGAKWTDEFWTTGECFGLSAGDGADYYTEGGFSSMINFSLQTALGKTGRVGSKIESTYKNYAKANMGMTKSLSYISSHDTTPLGGRGDLVNVGTNLLLCPGAIQIYYGDETARQLHSSPWGWKELPTRSDMNWSSIDKNVQAHWQKIGTFRSNHISVGAGSHTMISSEDDSYYAFMREYNKDGKKDTVVCVTNAKGPVTLDVSAAFSDGIDLRDYYTGKTAKVEDGEVTFTAGDKGVILIEKAVADVPVVQDKKLTAGAVTANPKTAVAGNEVTITTAKATGGASKYTYEFKVGDEVIQKASYSTSAKWTPEKAGEYTITVNTTDGDGTKVSKTLKYTVTDQEEPTDSSFIFNSIEPSTKTGTVGQKVTFTANTEGGTGDITYKLMVDSKQIEESEDGKFTWTPTEEKTYTIKIIAIDEENTQKVKSLSFSVAKSSDDQENPEDDQTKDLVATLKTSGALTQKIDTSIKLTADASGGTGNLTYKYVKIQNGKETTLVSGADKKEYSWKPAAEGEYTIKVVVSDENGKSVDSNELKFTITEDNGSDVVAFDPNKVVLSGLLFVLGVAGVITSKKRKIIK